MIKKTYNWLRNIFKHKCKNNLIHVTEEDYIKTFYLNIVAYCSVCGKKYILSNMPKKDYSKYNPNKNYKKIIENSLVEAELID